MQPAAQHETPVNTKGQRPISGLLGDVTRGMRELLREELRVARDEMGEKALDVGTDVGIIAAGGAVAYAGYLTVLGGAVDGLKGLGVPRWLAGMFVGAAAIGGGSALILRGLDNLKLKGPVVEGAREQFEDAVDDIQEEVS